MPYQDTWSETSKKQIQHDFYPLESIVSNFFKIIAHKFRSKKAEPRNLQEQIRIIRFLKWYLSKFFCYCCSAAKSCPTLLQPMDCNPPGSSVYEISQARILEWVVISFSRESSWPRKITRTSCIGRWVLYHWATKEAHRGCLITISCYCCDGLTTLFVCPLFIQTQDIYTGELVCRVN